MSDWQGAPLFVYSLVITFQNVANIALLTMK